MARWRAEPNWQTPTASQHGRLDTMKTVVAITIVFMAATAVDAQETDAIVLKMGRLSQDGSVAVQVVAVENHTSILLKLVKVECCFSRRSTDGFGIRVL